MSTLYETSSFHKFLIDRIQHASTQQWIRNHASWWKSERKICLSALETLAGRVHLAVKDIMFFMITFLHVQSSYGQFVLCFLCNLPKNYKADDKTIYRYRKNTTNRMSAYYILRSIGISIVLYLKRKLKFTFYM